MRGVVILWQLSSPTLGSISEVSTSLNSPSKRTGNLGASSETEEVNSQQRSYPTSPYNSVKKTNSTQTSVSRFNRRWEAVSQKNSATSSSRMRSQCSIQAHSYRSSPAIVSKSF